jgi:hypothetical protein
MRPACCVASAVILWACAAAPLPERPRALDPAHPDAPESKPLPASTALAREPGAEKDSGPRPGADEHEHGEVRGEHGAAEPGVAGFTCPMHPEVSQPEAGRCPKCGMPLEPRKTTTQPGSSARPDTPQHEGHEHHGEPR